MINRISDIIDMVPSYSEKVYAERPSPEMLESADAFFQLIPAFYRKIVSVDNITVNSGGTITIDWAVRTDFVSIEIGQGRVGFYCEMPDGINPEGVYNIADGFPPQILKALDKLYRRD